MNVYLTLLHYPVYNKNKQIIATSIVIHDIHDMARCGRTYGIKKFYIVQPFEGERQIVRRIKNFWNTNGKSYNPNRAEAIKIVSVKRDISEVLNEIKETEHAKPILIGTSARRRLKKSISYSELSKKIKEDSGTVLLIFGTGWGIAEEIEDMFDYFLPPIQGKTNYNHLSVRSAAAIVMDRLLGGDR